MLTRNQHPTCVVLTLHSKIIGYEVVALLCCRHQAHMDKELKTRTWDHPPTRRYVTSCIYVNLLLTSVDYHVHDMHMATFVLDIFSINSNK